ncbi:Uncharacterised protein [Vibrio cholerae]|nr:Uncharacterised protein [Vibrio cholerae]
MKVTLRLTRSKKSRNSKGLPSDVKRAVNLNSSP